LAKAVLSGSVKGMPAYTERAAIELAEAVRDLVREELARKPGESAPLESAE
jgi:hypothetical protein